MAPIGTTEIKATQFELLVWLERQPAPVRAIGGSVIGLLGSAQIGVRPHPMIVAHLKEDVAKLEQAALLSRQG